MNIEDTLRQYDWVVRFVLVAVAVVLVAVIANRLIAWQLTPMTIPTPRDFASQSQPSSQETSETTDSQSDAPSWDDAIADRCLFGCPDQEDEPKSCPGGCPDGKECQDGVCVPTDPPEDQQANKPDVPVKSDLNIRLMGCMVSGNPDYSMALVRDGESDDNYIISTGDRLPNDAKIVEIKRDRIYIRHEGQLQYIQIEQSVKGDQSPVSINTGRGRGRGLTRGPATPSPAQALERVGDESASDDGDDAEAERVSGQEYAVEEDTVEEKLENPEELAREGRAVPNYDDSGKNQRGIKLMGLSNSGIYSKLGFESGDVVRSVNGREVSSPRGARDLFKQLQDQGSISVEIERNGEAIERDYQLE